MNEAHPTGRAAAPGLVRWVRVALAVAGLAGVVLLVAATFSTIIEIKVLTVVKAHYTGKDRHGFALILAAVFGLLMLGGALRGARPAMVAVAAAGLLGLGIAVVGDAPDIHKTGRVAVFYEDARAGASTGFYLETLGGALLLLSGGGLLLLSGVGPPERSESGGSKRAAGRRRRFAGGGDAPPDVPEPVAKRQDDWFSES